MNKELYKNVIMVDTDSERLAVHTTTSDRVEVEIRIVLIVVSSLYRVVVR